MIRNLAYFLVGCLIILIVVYVGDLMIGMLVSGDIAHLATVILGILGLVAVIYLAYRIFAGSIPP